MKYLIAYYSWSGHTKMTAERIARVTGGNLFEIVPTEPYPRLFTIILLLRDPSGGVPTPWR